MKQDPNVTVQAVVEDAIENTGEIGLQVAAYLGSRLVIDVWAGLADQTTARRVDGDTLFPVFSVTKAITAVALHIQAERGFVDYLTPISRYWPEFAVNGKETATVYDALTHRLGLPMMPFGVTPELMCDWEWMTRQLAEMHPIFEPGTKAAYHSYTFGWIVGEIVRRTDPKGRTFSQFVQQEIAHPLAIDDLWIGIPDEVEPRIAVLKNIGSSLPPDASPTPPGVLAIAAIPPAVGTTQEVYGRADVRRASLPGSGGIMNARSVARFFAMLAQGGQLDGIRLLSAERVARFSVPRPPIDYDCVLGRPNNISIAGFHLAAPMGDRAPHPNMAPAGGGKNTFGHPGAGGQIGWADPDSGLAVAILRNRLIRHSELLPKDNPFVAIGDAVRSALAI
jgi:CubicO group peptidase (beta-lactamase class C family)